jgi:hypothetical protein
VRKLIRPVWSIPPRAHTGWDHYSAPERIPWNCRPDASGCEYPLEAFLIRHTVPRRKPIARLNICATASRPPSNPLTDLPLRLNRIVLGALPQSKCRPRSIRNDRTNPGWFHAQRCLSNQALVIVVRCETALSASENYRTCDSKKGALTPSKDH